MNTNIFEIDLDKLKTVHGDPPHKWGKEYWLENNKQHNYSAKLLQVNPGYVSSLHCHKTKSETFYVLYGELQIEIKYFEDRRLTTGKTINVGDKIRIERNTIHRFRAFEPSLVLEVASFEDEKTIKLEESKKID